MNTGNQILTLTFALAMLMAPGAAANSSATNDSMQARTLLNPGSTITCQSDICDSGGMLECNYSDDCSFLNCEEEGCGIFECGYDCEAPSLEECGNFAATGSFKYEGDGARWGSTGSIYVPCDEDDGEYSMGGTVTYDCELGSECEGPDDLTGRWGITDGNGYCAVQWSSGSQTSREAGGNIEYADDGSIKSMDGTCDTLFEGFMTTHGATSLLNGLL